MPPPHIEIIYIHVFLSNNTTLLVPNIITRQWSYITSILLLKKKLIVPHYVPQTLVVPKGMTCDH